MCFNLDELCTMPELDILIQLLIAIITDGFIMTTQKIFLTFDTAMQINP